LEISLDANANETYHLGLSESDYIVSSDVLEQRNSLIPALGRPADRRVGTGHGLSVQALERLADINRFRVREGERRGRGFGRQATMATCRLRRPVGCSPLSIAAGKRRS
jgi:hypothetical protein